LSGLGRKYWTEVIEILSSIIPVYDRVNRAISLGKDNEFRVDGIRGRVFSSDRILDAGSGYGNMSKLALEHVGYNAEIIMYDPIPKMLDNTRYFLGRKVTENLLSGIFEYMPFKSSSFDVIMCGYSLRDAIELKLAIREMHRVLKRGGRLIIVDLGKPDNPILRAGVAFYLKYVLGVLAFVFAGKAGLKFRTLYGTYLRWPKNSELETILKELFPRVEFKKGMMGGAVIIAAYK
jgi:demethylmenaquinone methyltransferase/2-methoxy-6-polyprenyl-1,4-benzoquinol methylase